MLCVEKEDVMKMKFVEFNYCESLLRREFDVKSVKCDEF